MMLVDAPIPEMRIALSTLLPAAVVVAAWTAALVRLVVRAQRQTSITGEAGMVGQTGVAETEMAPEGWVRVQGERWRAAADGNIAVGETITVTSVEGLKLRVRKGA